MFRISVTMKLTEVSGNDSAPSTPHGEIFKTQSIEEAIELAVRFKRRKQYDWFRGQTQQWIPSSTMARIADIPGKLHKSERRLAMFSAWLKNTPGLGQFSKDMDTVLAIAQHYGIPTTLIDFTTSPGVAGYFAAANAATDNSELGCIYCLNTKDLKEFWRFMRKCLKSLQDAPDMELICPKLPDLWRLEAQHGVFLYGPANWWNFYPPDRIVFPQSGLPSYPGKEDVYPARKSQLELLLDHYLHLEKFAGGEEMFRSVFPDVKITRLEPPPDRVEPRFFVNEKLPPLASWNASHLKRWQSVKKEELRTTALGEIALRLDLKSEPESLRQRASFGVRRALELDPSLRRKAVRWILLPQKRLQSRLSKSLDQIWNGMRVLPYNESDIADAIGLCFGLYCFGFADADREGAHKIAEMFLGDTVRVEFGSWDGSSAQGFASASDLRSAVREDINDYLLPKYHDRGRFVQPLLQLCSSPSRLFNFKRFVGVFGRQIIPCQALHGGDSPVFFSPARLEAFGLP